MSASVRATEKRIQRICAKFVEDLQAVFDADDCPEDLDAGEIYCNAVDAQSSAEDVVNGNLS